MTYLVTGAGGFLGLSLVKELVARGERVRALSRRRHPALDALGVETVCGDVRNAEAVSIACATADMVFHVAGLAGIYGPWSTYYDSNILGTKNVINACHRRRVKGLVYTSSASVTIDTSDQCGVDESAGYAKRWLCHYARSKAVAERYVIAANSRDGLRTCCLRPHAIFGPGDRHILPRLVDRARKGTLRRIGNGRNLTDVLYIDNAVWAHLQAADALAKAPRACGQVYFITQGEPVNCWRWIDDLLRNVAAAPVTKCLPTVAAYAIGAATEVVHKVTRCSTEPRMTRYLAALLGRSHYYNIGRARRHLGYEPTISTAEGMRRMAQADSGIVTE